MDNQQQYRGPIRPLVPPVQRQQTKLDELDLTKSATYNAVIVTPQMAEKWLTENYDNRPLNGSAISAYARQMAEGLWKLNGESLKFDKNGRMFDGQHRLYACVEANTSFVTDIRAGLDRSVFDTLDTGKPRGGSDILALRGEKYTFMLSASAGLLWRYERGVIIRREVYAKPTEIAGVIDAHPGLRDSCHFMVCHKPRIVPPATLAVGHYLAAQKHPKEAVDNFYLKLITGAELAPDSAIYTIRKRFENAKVGRRLLREEIFALLIKGWNLHIENRPVKLLRLEVSEGFPEVR